jgi:hypothetical protein
MSQQENEATAQERECTMIERGSSKHGPHVDDELKHEIEGDLRGGRPGHVEEWRQPEPFPDDTDDDETRAAMERGTPPVHREPVQKEPAQREEEEDKGD